MARSKVLQEDKKETIKDSKSIMKQIMEERKSEHLNFQERVDWRVSTGSILLDLATGGVRPSLWRLCGNNNCGKTPQTLEIIRNMFLNLPVCRGVWFLAEGRGLSEQNVERCGLKFVYHPDKWENHSILVLESNIFEFFIHTVKELVYNNPENCIYAFVVDSVDGLILRDDAKKDITENNKVAGVPALSKRMMQSLSLGMFKFGHWMGLISQVTAEIKLDPYTKTPNRGGNFSGGNALLHGSDVILNYEPAYNDDFILNNPTGRINDGKTKALGQNVKVTMLKTTIEEFKKTLIKYPIKYGKKPSGIWQSREIGDIMLGWSWVKKSGSWYNLDPELLNELKENNFNFPEKVQGLEAFYDILDQNEDVYNYLYNKVMNILT